MMFATRVIMCAGAPEFEFSIAASAANPNIWNLAKAAGWNEYSRLVCNITAQLINTLDTGSVVYPGGLRINQSAATRVGGVRNGGDAFIARVPVEYNNLGILSGGGGRGGAGSNAWVFYSDVQTYATGGGGGNGQGFVSASSLTVAAADAFGGPGETREYQGSTVGQAPYATSGAGGAGGAWGAVGGTGQYGSIGGNYQAGSAVGPQGLGEAAGAAVNGDSRVSWINQGTIQGARVG